MTCRIITSRPGELSPVLRHQSVKDGPGEVEIVAERGGAVLYRGDLRSAQRLLDARRDADDFAIRPVGKVIYA